MPKSAALFELPELASSPTTSESGVAVTVSAAAVLVASTGAVVVVVTMPSMVSDKSSDRDVSDGMVVEVEGSSVGSEVLVAASVWDGSRDVRVDRIWEGAEVSWAGGACVSVTMGWGSTCGILICRLSRCESLERGLAPGQHAYSHHQPPRRDSPQSHPLTTDTVPPHSNHIETS